MTFQEINKYLAEKLFDIDIKNYRRACSRYECQKEECVRKCINTLPDYIQNWQQVIETLTKNTKEVNEVQIGFTRANTVYCEFIDQIGDDPLSKGKGATIGIAVCRATVNYLKRGTKSD